VGVDKSVVARWAIGATQPSSHNLAALSLLVARTVPGFTTLDWDRPLDDLAARLGVEPTPGANASRRSEGLELPFLDQVRATTALRGPVYEGFYRSTRPYAGYPGRYLHDHLMVRAGEDGLLRLHMRSGGVRVEGWVLPMNTQLFVLATEFASGSMVFALLHGVAGNSAAVLDGITLFASLDNTRTPAATPIVLERIGELGADRAADDERLAQLDTIEPASGEADVREAVRRQLARDVGGEWVLRLPLALSLSRGLPPLHA
jgi:hypothetical protein